MPEDQSVEEKLIDSFEFLLPALVALKVKYKENNLIISALQVVLYSISVLITLLRDKES